MRAWLEFSDGSRYEAGNGTKIGRNPKNDIALPSNKVSNQHCGIVETMEDGFQVVEAKATTNGTFVNGSRVQGSASLKNGDTLRIADLEYTFIVDESPPFQPQIIDLSDEEPEKKGSDDEEFNEDSGREKEWDDEEPEEKAEDRAVFAIQDAKAEAPNVPPRSATNCQQAFWIEEYAQWQRMSTAQKREMVNSDPHKYVVLRSLDLRIQKEDQHSFGECYGVAIVEIGGKRHVWLSHVGGGPIPDRDCLTHERVIRPAKHLQDKWGTVAYKQQEVNDHHAEMVFERELQDGNYTLIASATTRRPCDATMFPTHKKHCIKTYVPGKETQIPKITRSDAFVEVANSIQPRKKRKAKASEPPKGEPGPKRKKPAVPEKGQSKISSFFTPKKDGDGKGNIV